ncbi:hypothetical protein [Xanthomonas albilineans]|uniref:hypothetical protein n=1 Tax=Xanthomonas albilineans TaxID=29447 RepID=UPI0012D383C1|nr:hypothetical protein [Xanthomonas albilineans]
MKIGNAKKEIQKEVRVLGRLLSREEISQVVGGDRPSPNPKTGAWQDGGTCTPPQDGGNTTTKSDKGVNAL